MPFKLVNIRFSVLLVLTILLIILVPFLRGFIRIKLLLDILTSTILVAAIWVTGQRKYDLLAGVGLALPYLALTWLNYAVKSQALVFASTLVGILFFGFVVSSILRYIFHSREVSRETIFAAIESYLLLAIIWAYGYSALDQIFPASFSVPDGVFESGGFHFFYFSFVTITTLGYGDISPLTEKAAALAIVEALVGQIYLVVLVAWLVGMYVSKKSR